MSVRLTKEQSRKRRSELRALLNKWDFIGVMRLGAPQDEYDCIAGPLMRRLESDQSAAELSQYLERIIPDRFGLDGVTGIEDFSVKVKTWYETHWPGTTV